MPLMVPLATKPSPHPPKDTSPLHPCLTTIELFFLHNQHHSYPLPGSSSNPNLAIPKFTNLSSLSPFATPSPFAKFSLPLLDRQDNPLECNDLHPPAPSLFPSPPSPTITYPSTSDFLQSTSSKPFYSLDHNFEPNHKTNHLPTMPEPTSPLSDVVLLAIV